ncbi:SRPBCC family protein [Falsigemmobacter intermedius]|uniref:SRPBCC family protein n=1 Tax=Falsigemmobacter intermedius TaxID=1553448 RepID=UPI003EFC074C
MNRRSFFALSLPLLLVPHLGLAHGPTPQRAEQSLEIAAAPDRLWALLSDPALYADWHPAVASVEMEGSGAGAKRRVTFVAGGSVLDGIDRIDDAAMEIRWRLSEEAIEVFPVSHYTHTVKITPEGDGASVTWKSSFFRADTTNEPEERFSDEAAVAAVEALIRSGLEGLKARAEQKS